MKMFKRFFWCLLIGAISFPITTKAITPVGISPYYGQQGFSKGYFDDYRLKACWIKGLRVSFPFFHQKVREKGEGSFWAIDFDYGTGKAKYGEGENWDALDPSFPSHLGLDEEGNWIDQPDTPPRIDGNVKVSVISFNPSYGYVALRKSGNETEDFSNESYEFYALIGAIIGKVTFDPNISYDPEALSYCRISLPNENEDFSLKSGLCFGLFTRLSVSLYKNLAINGEFSFNSTPNKERGGHTSFPHYKVAFSHPDRLWLRTWKIGLSLGF